MLSKLAWFENIPLTIAGMKARDAWNKVKIFKQIPELSLLQHHLIKGRPVFLPAAAYPLKQLFGFQASQPGIGPVFRIVE